MDAEAKALRLTAPMTTSANSYIIGVDLGGTNIVVGAMSADGVRQYAMHSTPTPPRSEGSSERVVERMIEMVEVTIAETLKETGAKRGDILGVGIGAPGPLDRENGVVIIAPNLGWHNLPLRSLISDAVQLPCTLDNDANCATYGEWWVGAARGARNVVGITIGTGIGGGLIIDGKLYHGSSDVAGEIGHMTIDQTGRRCGCGNYGCLEAYASGPNIAERAREALRSGDISVLPSMVGGDLERISAATVYEAAHKGDVVAREVVRDTAKFLGVGLAN